MSQNIPSPAEESAGSLQLNRDHREPAADAEKDMETAATAFAGGQSASEDPAGPETAGSGEAVFEAEQPGRNGGAGAGDPGDDPESAETYPSDSAVGESLPDEGGSAETDTPPLASGEGAPDETALSGASSAASASGGSGSDETGPAEEEPPASVSGEGAPDENTLSGASSAASASGEPGSAGGDLTETGTEESASAETAGKELENTLDTVRRTPRKKRRGKQYSYNEKLLRHQRRLYRRTVIGVLALMLILTAGILVWMYHGYSRAELHRVALLEAEDGMNYEGVRGNVVQYGSSGAVCLDQRGKELWNISYDMQQPISSVSGEVIAIANRSGYQIYVMNAKGLMGTIHTMLPIHSIAAAENGEVAVIMNDSKVTWIRLYKADGSEIAYLTQTIEENGYPIAAAVSPDGETICLSSVQMSNSAVKSNISFYNFGKRGQKTPDYRVDSSDYLDQVIPVLRYVDRGTCIGISDAQLIYFRRGLLREPGTSIVRFNEELQGAFYSENYTGLLFHNTGENSSYRLDIYNGRGGKTGEVCFSMQYSDIQIAGDKVYIYNDKECGIYTFDGSCLYSGTLGKNIRALIPGADLVDLLVVTGGELDSVRLH